MTWHSGDLALCIATGTWIEQDNLARINGRHPRPGEILTVVEVDAVTGDVFLVFDEDGISYWHGYEAAKFRRIAPLTQAEHRQAVEEMGVREDA